MARSTFMRFLSVVCFAVAGLIYLHVLHVAHGGPAFTEFGVAAYVASAL